MTNAAAYMLYGTQKERLLTFPCLIVDFNRFSATSSNFSQKTFHPRCRRCFSHKLCSLLRTFLTDSAFYVSVEDPRPRFSDSAFKLYYSFQ